MSVSALRRLCAYENCQNPAHHDPRTGITHDYCGRYHASLAVRERGEELRPPHGPCHTCALPGCDRPVFFENGRVHEFCCRTHAHAAISQGFHPPSQRGERAESVAERCSLPGCSAPKWSDPTTGRVMDYCGRTHAQAALDRQLVPPSFEPRAQSAPEGSIYKIFRGRNVDYTVYVLNNIHPKVPGVVKQFQNSWTHETPIPRVIRVLQIRNSREVFARYENEYKPSVAARCSSGNPNEERRFHGTSLASLCKFGIDLEQPPCTDPNCSVCSIIESGFDLSRAGASGGQIMRLRYGQGTYFSQSSSKANDYAGNSERPDHSGRRTRVMFLCKVTLGRIYQTIEPQLEQQQIDQLSANYDSLLGLTHHNGGALNHPENVIYSSSAAIPSYLIVYRV
mmetsp:Transcript_7097/g.10586  ORF Transcript_7097/g.10586 Transcript_7097/m.10586 type:complete len:395 (+) Transcript_7097:68-1252(+)|eukprot:CAMPEP_0197312968 /NCGR_PEP_ID=MMETSP0891-20130614/24506_1 /TAXON_ID=44058 ORGANISM="Aureoumbra lagunensis, Strain CCMP1510" /NCGR_SAMPLE_ID=MMETSP0891 /ASSEMBLY_ACC=CAM_ASM_000534 /LENGTH=394 /DNA_ID=CAMNT_0042800503 /DNA_START=38 /DNA_END=1222 /DNA_ORIENTATION=-